MTSTPSQSSTPAQSTPAANTAPSYASAAGSSKKAPSTAGQAASHNAKSASISNGRPAVTPALPVQGVSGIATGETSRKNSVTIGANGSTYPGSVNHSHKNSIKFGNFDSPVMSHSTPQVSAAPQQLPSNSPAPPSPIPISAVSGGGRPPSVALGGMTFGSLGSDDRSRQPQHGPPPPSAHGRRESAQSAAGSDMGSQNHNRNSYHGRGRSFNNGGSGSFNSHHNQMGFPPTNYRGNAGPGGRGGMPFQPGSHSHGGHSQNRGPMHVTNSPQPSRSPHLANSALSTPNMPPASLAQPIAAQTPPHQYYHQPMGGMPPVNQPDTYNRVYPAFPGNNYDPLLYTIAFDMRYTPLYPPNGYHMPAPYRQRNMQFSSAPMTGYQGVAPLGTNNSRPSVISSDPSTVPSSVNFSFRPGRPSHCRTNDRGFRKNIRGNWRSPQHAMYDGTDVGGRDHRVPTSMTNWQESSDYRQTKGAGRATYRPPTIHGNPSGFGGKRHQRQSQFSSALSSVTDENGTTSRRNQKGRFRHTSSLNDDASTTMQQDQNVKLSLDHSAQRDITNNLHGKRHQSKPFQLSDKAVQSTPNPELASTNTHRSFSAGKMDEYSYWKPTNKQKPAHIHRNERKAIDEVLPKSASQSKPASHFAVQSWKSTSSRKQYGYPPNPSGQFSMSQNMSMGVPGYQYNMPPYGGPPNGPPYGQNFNAPAFTPGAPAAPMVRSGSQQADKPAPSAPQSFAPIVGSGAPPAPGGKSAFVRPAKSAAIRITTPQGEAVDLSTVKAPVSPAPAAASKAPAAASSTPARAGANAHPIKTTKEVQDELRLKIAQLTNRGAAESPAKDEAKEAAEKEVAEKEAAEKEAAEKAAAEAKAEAEAKAKEEAEAKAKATAEAEAKAKAEEEAKAKAAAPALAAAPVSEEDEMERMIREMEEAERLEAEREAAYELKKAEEKAKQSVIDAANKKKNDAEADRKLREQEREMERLEEEKERRRAQGGPTKSFSELMALARSGKELPTEEKPSTDAASDKTPKIPKIEAPAGSGRGDNKARKPAALNLVPLASKAVEPAQPSAALQSLKSARFLTVMNSELYPSGILSPNPALNSAVSKKGKTFQYDAAFLLQFKTVFTEQPSVEFQSQVKTLIGDESNRGSARSSTPRTGSSKGGAANPIGAPIGGFGSGRMGSGPGGMVPRSGTNPIGQFSRGSSFPSSRNASGNIPGSPRVGSSRAGRNNSNRHPKADKQAAQMPLTAGQEIKPIAVTESGWKPISLAQKPGSGAAGGPMDPAMVQRKVKAALNKMTPENFERISEQIMAIAGQSKDETDGRTLRQVIQLTFEKATDEAHWASMYAKFCKRMLDNTSNDIKDDSIKDKNGAVVTGGTLFRKYLLNRCQEEFERGWKVNLPKPEAGDDSEAKNGEAALLSDEYYAAAAAKRRGLGLVQFIGELYKLGMLTDRIMHGCIRGMVDFNGEPDESEIESLSKLLTTIGGALESSTNSPPGRNSALMDAYFDRIKSVIENPNLNSRLKFMLMDVVDLRKKGWKGKEVNKGPKTLDEVRADAEAAAAAKAAEAAKATRGGPGGRPPMGHGDARSYSNGPGGHSNSNQISKDDFKRLRGIGGRSGGHNVTLGPGGSLNSRSNSGRHRLGPTSMLSRNNDDSASSSRTGTPAPSMNAFDVLANLDNHPGSPPSAAASPALAKATPDTGDKE